MHPTLIGLLAGSAFPTTASASLVTAFFQITPSTTSTATIDYGGTYVTSLPNPTAAPFSVNRQASIATGGTGTGTVQHSVPVLEPTSLILLGSGILIFGLVKWWRSRRATRRVTHNITLTLR